MPLDERLQTVHQLKLCLNCLGEKHYASNCTYTSGCKECGQRHNTTLHGAKPRYGRNNDNNTSTTNDRQQTQMPTTNVTSYSISKTDNNTTNATLLYLIPVTLHNKEHSMETYAFLDPGSTISFIMTTAANKLNLEQHDRQH